VLGILAIFGKLLAKEQIELVTEIPSGLPPVHCSLPQIQQVLLNLLTNARDALNERYPDHHPDKKVEVTVSLFADQTGKNVRFTVFDHGNGIPTEVQPQIFNPFFTTKDISCGTGLGLSISHTIASQHGGRLSFETWPGKGTRFHLDLPVDNGIPPIPEAR